MIEFEENQRENFGLSGTLLDCPRAFKLSASLVRNQVLKQGQKLSEMCTIGKVDGMLGIP